MKDSRPVSLQAIARRAGVSRMAVSLALRGRPGVSPRTRQRVLAVAKRMGYAPDPELGKLMARMRQKISNEVKSCLAYLVPGNFPEARIISPHGKKIPRGGPRTGPRVRLPFGGIFDGPKGNSGGPSGLDSLEPGD